MLSVLAVTACTGAGAAAIPTAPTNNGELKIQFVASKPCALVMFINILADRHHTSTWVKEWYEKNCKSTPSLIKNLEADKIHLAAYRKLIDKEEKHFNYVDEVGVFQTALRQLLLEARRFCFAWRKHPMSKRRFSRMSSNWANGLVFEK